MIVQIVLAGFLLSLLWFLLTDSDQPAEDKGPNEACQPQPAPPPPAGSDPIDQIKKQPNAAG